MLTATLLSAFLMGLIGSTHCVGMCGGIISALSTNLASDKHVGGIFTIQLFYNVGRITSYTLFGLMAGLFSSKLMDLLPDPHAFSMIIAGVFFVLLGLYISQLLNSFRYLEAAGQKLWTHIEPLGRKYVPASTIGQAWRLGLVWGWLPCGLVYSALALSMTQLNPIHAGLSMLVFGLGTLPTLLIVGHFATHIKIVMQHKALRLGLGSLLILYGISQIVGISALQMHAH
jgi:sulfite exporter TauE/SafE